MIWHGSFTFHICLLHGLSVSVRCKMLICYIFLPLIPRPVISSDTYMHKQSDAPSKEKIENSQILDSKVL